MLYQRSPSLTTASTSVQLLQRLERRRVHAALDVAEPTRGDPGGLGELFLGQVLLPAQLLQAGGQIGGVVRSCEPLAKVLAQYTGVPLRVTPSEMTSCPNE